MDNRLTKAGRRGVVHVAAGGVGIAATQIAKRVGAEVYGTASAGKHDAIRAHGVDVALDLVGVRAVGRGGTAY